VEWIRKEAKLGDTYDLIENILINIALDPNITREQIIIGLKKVIEGKNTDLFIQYKQGV